MHDGSTEGSPRGSASALREALDEALARAAACEARARRAEELLDLARDGVWAIDAAGATTFVNARMAEMLGYAPSEMMGRSVFDFTDEEGRAITVRNMERRRAGIAEEHDFRLVHRDGRVVWTTMNTGPVRAADGSYAGAIAVVRDVTERRAVEEERDRLRERMVHAQKLESVGALAGGLAHDFNNLLAVMVGHTDLALEGLRRAEAARVERSLQAILGAAQAATRLTAQLLAYSGGAAMESGSLSLGRLLQQVRVMLSPGLAPGLTIDIEAAETPPVVVGEHAQIEQLLMNLVSNAIESHEGRPGRVTLAASEETLTEEAGRLLLPHGLPPGRYARVRVRDRGVGIPPERQTQVFDPFFTTKSYGHGLGLAAALGIVRAHGGGIRLTSEPGEGTTFDVYLPAAGEATEPSAPRPASPAMPVRGEGLVLVIDDEAAVREVARRALELAGFEVCLAGGGLEGVRLLGELLGEVRAVVLDMTMPDLSGPETLERLRALDPGLPVVLCSGYAAGDLQADPRLRGVAGFVAKPFRLADLAAAVAEHAARAEGQEAADP